MLLRSDTQIHFHFAPCRRTILSRVKRRKITLASELELAMEVASNQWKCLSHNPSSSRLKVFSPAHSNTAESYTELYSKVIKI